jgi:hypothetical protein
VFEVGLNVDDGQGKLIVDVGQLVIEAGDVG